MRKKDIVLSFLYTLALTGTLLTGFAFFHHVRPRLQALRQAEVALAAAAEATSAPSPAPTAEPAEEPAAETAEESDNRSEWAIRFQDHFTDTIIKSERSYSSPDIAFTITEHEYKKYDGHSCKYYVTDVYVASLDQLRTCLAGDICQSFYAEPIGQIAEQHGALLAVNGDYYSLQLYEELCITVRNGVVYREGKGSTGDICVLFNDGRMETYAGNEYTTAELMEMGARDIWHFGPRLLLEDGSINEDYGEKIGISGKHPRAAIGYYEPGHYCFLITEGRNKDKGISFAQLAEIMSSLGCVRAYNLDGGASAQLWYDGETLNAQDQVRSCGDIIYLYETYTEEGDEK